MPGRSSSPSLPIEATVWMITIVAIWNRPSSVCGIGRQTVPSGRTSNQRQSTPGFPVMIQWQKWLKSPTGCTTPSGFRHPQIAPNPPALQRIRVDGAPLRPVAWMWCCLVSFPLRYRSVYSNHDNHNNHDTTQYPGQISLFRLIPQVIPNR